MDDRTRFCVAFVFAVLVPAFCPGVCYGRNNLVMEASSQMDVDEIEKLFILCGLDLMRVEKAVKESDTLVSGRLDIEFSEVLPLEMKNSFLDCVSRRKSYFMVSGDEYMHTHWIIEYLQYILGWHPPSRRNLANKSASALLANYAPAPAPALGPAPGPAPASMLESPVSSPSPAPSPTISEHFDDLPPSQAPFLPRDIPPPNFQPFAGSANASSQSSNHSSSNKRAILIAVVTTAAGTIFFVVVLFCFYKRCCDNSSGDGQRDEKPLLALSMSTFSTGSSPKRFGLENSIDKEGFQSLSLKINPGETLSSRVFPRTVNSFKEPYAPSSYSNMPMTSIPSMMPATISNNHPSQPPPAESWSDPSPVRGNPSPPGPPSPPSPQTGIKLSGMTAGPSPPQPPPPPPTMQNEIRPVPSPPPPPPPGNHFRPPRPPQPNPNSSRASHFSPLGPNRIEASVVDGGVAEDAPKAKLKPFFWDKVLANPDHSMVWHQIRSGSFQFNEEMIESLFGYNSTEKIKAERKKYLVSNDPSQRVQILDPKKAQNLLILLRALNVTSKEVCDAILEGNELPLGLLQTLSKMAPTKEEEHKLRLYSGDFSQLSPAEQFLKALVDIPFAFKRIDALLFMCSLQEEVASVKKSFETLQEACNELKSSRLFRRLLEAVLKTGNRMNDGTFRGGAQAFKLDTLLKLADVKGTDGKTTLLHFVVQEIIRYEGVRIARVARETEDYHVTSSDDMMASSPLQETTEHYCALGLQVVSGLGGELQNVKKAAVLDADALTSSVATLELGLVKVKAFLSSDMQNVDQSSGFCEVLRSFIEHADIDITWLIGEERRVRTLIKNTTDYFHGNSSRDEGLRLFIIVRDFLRMLDKACKEVKEVALRKAPKTAKNREALTASPSSDIRQLLFPAIKDRRIYSSSSDEED